MHVPALLHTRLSSQHLLCLLLLKSLVILPIALKSSAEKYSIEWSLLFRHLFLLFFWNPLQSVFFSETTLKPVFQSPMPLCLNQKTNSQ
jgi:hypothetical protein